MHLYSKNEQNRGHSARRYRGKHRCRQLLRAHTAGIGLQQLQCTTALPQQREQGKGHRGQGELPYPQGDSVVLAGSVRQGMRASVLAYVVPLVLMLAALFVGTNLAGEGIGALAALLVLALYYGGLFLLRDKLRKTFEFRIEVSSTTNL